MGKLQFIKKDGTVLDYSTPSVDVLKNIPTVVKVSLWESVGKRIPLSEVQAVGLNVQYIPDQTQARMEYERITFMYGNIPEFATRVTELKNMYDQLEVPYNCTVADITNALNVKFESVDDRTTFLATFNSLLDKGVKLNYQAGQRLYCGYTAEDLDPIDDFIMWVDFPILIKWLPGNYNESDVPVFREVEVINTTEREQEILAEIDSDYIEPINSSNSSTSYSSSLSEEISSSSSSESSTSSELEE